MCISSDDCAGETHEELESSEVCIPFKFSMLTFVLYIFFGKQKRSIHSHCYSYQPFLTGTHGREK